MRTVRDCPCGNHHRMSDVRHGRLRETLERRSSPLVLWATPDGMWRVPFVFLFNHSTAASELPALAERYGWEQVKL